MNDSSDRAPDPLSLLRAGLDEDERIACTAAESFAPEGRRAEWHEEWSGSLNVGDELHVLSDSTVTRHAERFDPARVLRQVEKLREAADLLDSAVNGSGPEPDLLSVCTELAELLAGIYEGEEKP